MPIRVQQPGGGLPSTTYFTVGSPAGGATGTPPYAFYCQFKAQTTGSLGAVFATITRMPPGFGGYQGYWFGLESPPGLRVWLNRRNGGGASFSTLPITPGTWHRAAGRIPSSASGRVCLDGIWGTESTASNAAPSGLEETLFFAHPTVTIGTFNKGYNGCSGKLVVWNGTIPSEADFDAIMAGTSDPEDFPEGIFRLANFNDEGSATEVYTWNGSSLVLTTDLTLHVDEANNGSITTCEDSPEEPVEPAEEECGIEDEADAIEPCDVEWPECDLVPTDIDVEVVSPTKSPGRSFNGNERVVQQDSGYWRITLTGIKVWTEEELLLWRDIESTLNGRNGTCCVPFYEGKLSATPIVATAGTDATIGASRMGITQSAGATVQNGMHFSVGDYGYVIERVFGTDGDGITSVLLWPPLREAITTGQSLNFNTPKVRCRLERDDGMEINLELLTFAKQTVVFVEDV